MCVSLRAGSWWRSGGLKAGSRVASVFFLDERVLT